MQRRFALAWKSTQWQLEDELLSNARSLPRTRRDELKPRIVMLAERLQSDSKQLRKWHDDHWDENNTLHW
ncbi:hypothetical protein [Synechococcus sp. MIT S9501]|uniref:hypothetical protein n=1 Tax=Synechococcus sp. MIT S9501 TaxID=3082545 RepID=UPI0039B3A3E1